MKAQRAQGRSNIMFVNVSTNGATPAVRFELSPEWSALKTEPAGDDGVSVTVDKEANPKQLIQTLSALQILIEGCELHLKNLTQVAEELRSAMSAKCATAIFWDFVVERLGRNEKERLAAYSAVLCGENTDTRDDLCRQIIFSNPQNTVTLFRAAETIMGLNDMFKHDDDTVYIVFSLCVFAAKCFVMQDFDAEDFEKKAPEEIKRVCDELKSHWLSLGVDPKTGDAK